MKTTNYQSYTFRLFKKKMSVTEGIASLMDFYGTGEKRIKTDKTEKDADYESLLSDWFAVGEDMNKAIKNVTATNK